LGKDREDVFVEIERLEMVIEIQEFDEDKLFKIAYLNLWGETNS